MRAVHVDSQGEILNLELITVEKERAIRAEAWAEDEKMRADTISSRIQEVNNALLVAEDRIEELEVKLSEAHNLRGLALDTFNASQGNSKYIIREWLEGAGK